MKMFKAHDKRLSMMLVEFGVIVLGAVTLLAGIAGIITGIAFGISKLIWWLGDYDEKDKSIKKKTL